MTRLATWVAILLTVAMAYGTVSLWQTGRHPWESPPPPKTEQQLIQEEQKIANEEDVEYLAAIIRHSFRGSPLERLLVGLAAKNVAEIRGLSYREVFTEAAEMVPPWSKKEAYVRVRWVVMALATTGEAAAARSLARQILTGRFEEPYATMMANLSESQQCVTTYYRPEGNKNPQSDTDLRLMRTWEPKAYIAHDGAFWLCLPAHRPH